MVTQAQLDELGTRTEQEQARTITEQILTQQGLATPLSQRTIGVQRLVQFFISEPEAVVRQRASGILSVGEAAAIRTGVRFVGEVTPSLTERALQQSIPAELRGLSPAEVQAGQEFQRIQSFLPQQTIQQTLKPTEREVFQKQDLPLAIRDIPVTTKERVGKVIGIFGEPTERLIGVDITPRFLPTQRRDIPFTTFQELGREFVIPKKERISEIGSFVTTPTLLDINLFKQPKEVRRGVVSGFLSGLEFGVRGVAEFIPTTPVETIVFVATPPVLGKFATTLPKTARIVFGTGAIVEGIGVIEPGITPEERVTAGVSAGLFGAGAIFAQTRFQLGVKEQKLQVGELLRRDLISEETAVSLREGIKLQKFLRGIGDVPVIKSPVEAFPKGLTIPEQEAFVRVALEGKIFGSQAIRLRGLQKLGGDIDIAFKENIKVIGEFQKELELVSGKPLVRTKEAIGFVGEEKFFDIKPLERTEAFPFVQKGVPTPEKGEITRLSEQFSRTLSGTLGLRKGGKDIGAVIISGRALVGREAAIVQDIRFPPFKVFKQFRQTIAERRLAKLELALPEFEVLVARAGQAEIAPVEGRFVPSTKFPEVIDILPRGTRAQLDFFAPRGKPTKIEPIIKLEPRIKLDPKFVPKDIVKPTRIKPSRLKPSRFRPIAVPSFFQPGLRPSITPSFIRELKPSIISDLGEPRRPPPSIIPSDERLGIGLGDPIVPEEIIEGFGDFDFRKPKPRRRKIAERKRKPKKPKKLKRRTTPIRPSFTAIVAELTGGLPEITTIGGREIGILPTKLRRL